MLPLTMPLVLLSLESNRWTVAAVVINCPLLLAVEKLRGIALIGQPKLRRLEALVVTVVVCEWIGALIDARYFNVVFQDFSKVLWGTIVLGSVLVIGRLFAKLILQLESPWYHLPSGSQRIEGGRHERRAGGNQVDTEHQSAEEPNDVQL